MVSSALIFVDNTVDSDERAPRALLKVAGLTLLERQLRQLRDVGVTDVRLVSRQFPELLHGLVGGFRKVPVEIKVIDANMPADAATLGAAEDHILVLEDGVLIDDRVIAAVLGTGSDAAIAVFPPRAVVYGQGAGVKVDVGGAGARASASASAGFEAGDGQLFASCALVPGSILSDLSGLSDLLTPDMPAEPLVALLALALEKADPESIDISRIETYIPARRRKVPLLWRPVTAPAECHRATRVLLGMAQKGVLDWPARWVHPIFEDMTVAALVHTPVTPNMITLLTALLGAGIAYLFATGNMGLALAGALIVGVLDGVDGKLARVKRLTSKIGEMEHLVDKLVEYSWYFAIAWYLAGSSGDGTGWALALVIVGFAWAETVQGELFRRLTLKQLDDAGPFERGFRLIGARRNTLMWTLIPFALTEQWLIGFWVAAIYTLVTFFVAQWRFIVRIRDYAFSSGSSIADNIKKTEYF